MAESDEQLMARVQRGERPAYDQLYARWAQRSLRFLMRRLGSHVAAEEALQDTWLNVYRYRGSYDPARSFAPWLFTIAANAGKRAPKPAPSGFTFETSTEDRPELRDLLVKALHRLEDDDNRVLLLSIEGFNSSEIAGMLDMKPSSVRMRLKRARTRLREELGGVDG